MTHRRLRRTVPAGPRIARRRRHWRAWHTGPSLVLALAGAHADAALVTFTDRASWEAAVIAQKATLAREDFNTFPDQSFLGSSIDFGDFSIAGPDNTGVGINSIDAAPFGESGQDRNVDGTTYVLGGFLQTTWTIAFDVPVLAFGWDSRRDFDGEWSVDGTPVDYEQGASFFGVVEDSPLRTTFSSISMTGRDTTFGTDNYIYGIARAPSFTTFTDRAAWTAAAQAQSGVISGEDFDAFPDQSFSNGTFDAGDFTIANSSPIGSDANSIDAAPSGDGGQDRNVDGTTYVLGGYFNDPWTITLDNPTFAFGWDSRRDFDGDWNILGTPIDYVRGASFFGVVENNGLAFNTVEMTGRDTTFGTDNYIYASPGAASSSTVSEPGAAALSAAGLLLAGWLRRRTRGAVMKTA